MTKLEAIFLGLVQGLAEFLPISSSGHLSVFQRFFGISAGESNLFFDVLLHLGTLISVCVVYWSDIVQIVRELIQLLKGLGHPVPGEQKRYPAVRLLLMMAVSCVVLFLVLPVKDAVESLTDHTGFIGFALIMTGFMLFVADRMPRGQKNEKNMRFLDAIIIGVCQGVATIPGLSRSGTTITAGLATGLEREFAVKFSFLISIPAILAANLLELVHAVKAGIDTAMISTYLLGMLVAMVSGFFALNLVKLISKKGRFGGFACYCWAAGAITILLTIIL